MIFQPKHTLRPPRRRRKGQSRSGRSREAIRRIRKGPPSVSCQAITWPSRAEGRSSTLLQPRALAFLRLRGRTRIACGPHARRRSHNYVSSLQGLPASIQ